MLRLYYSTVQGLKPPEDLGFLSDYRREKLAQITSPKGFALSLGAELLLIEALRLNGGCKLPLNIKTNKSGKPELEGGHCFSLSHSGDFVLCALSDRAVGADVQKLAPYNQGLARRFFTSEECQWLERENSDSAFTQLWSLKESVVKYYGKGISGLHLNSFSVIMDGGSPHIQGSHSLKLWSVFRDEVVFSLCSRETEPECFEKLNIGNFYHI